MFYEWFDELTDCTKIRFLIFLVKKMYECDCFRHGAIHKVEKHPSCVQPIYTSKATCGQHNKRAKTYKGYCHNILYDNSEIIMQYSPCTVSVRCKSGFSWIHV